jgi:hypothetical protein
MFLGDMSKAAKKIVGALRNRETADFNRFSREFLEGRQEFEDRQKDADAAVGTAMFQKRRNLWRQMVTFERMPRNLADSPEHL